MTAPTVADRPGSSPERGTVFAVETTDATRRQLECWCRAGLLGDRHYFPGTGRGRYREFTDHDLEIVQTLARLAALGCRGDWLAAGAHAIRDARVQPGELLVVTLVGCTTDRTGEPVFPTGPAWVVPLTPFSEGHPS